MTGYLIIITCILGQEMVGTLGWLLLNLINEDFLTHMEILHKVLTLYHIRSHTKVGTACADPGIFIR